MPYDSFMEAEGVPVFRGIGVRRVQDLPMRPWARLGGRGTYIQLYGTEGLWGMYVVEVPGAGALNVERHLYEKIVLVVEGRGIDRGLAGRPEPSAMPSNGRGARCSPFRSMRSIASSMRRARRRCCCAAPRRRT